MLASAVQYHSPSCSSDRITARIAVAVALAGSLSMVSAIAFGQAPPNGAREPSPPTAASDPAEAEWGEGRMLGGHSFPVPVFVPTSFTVSSFGMRAGIESRTVPGYSSGWFASEGKAGTRTDLATVSASESLDLAVRLHRLIALQADGYGRARVGANAPALLGTGADYEYGVNGGVLLRLLRIAPVQLSLRASGGYFAGQKAGFSRLFQDLLSIARAVAERAIENETTLQKELDGLNVAFAAVAGSLVTTYRGNRFAASLDAAVALGRFVGLQLAAGIGLDRALYRSSRYDAEEREVRYYEQLSTTLRLMGAVAADLDLAPIGVPVDLVVEYAPEHYRRELKLARRVSNETVLEQRIAVGVYYSGRTDLQLGVNGYSLLGQFPELGANARQSGRPRDLGGQFVFRYIW